MPRGLLHEKFFFSPYRYMPIWKRLNISRGGPLISGFLLNYCAWPISMSNQPRHILVVDDNASIHDDFRKIFGGTTPDSSLLDHAAVELFGAAPVREKPTYQLNFASQGQDALEMVRAAIANQRPYSMAFLDVQMPPGWDGVQTMAEIWKIAPDLHIVLCTAFSSYSFEEIQNVGRTDQVVVLKKPFDAIEVLQMANVFSEKWQLLNEVRERADRKSVV